MTRKRFQLAMEPRENLGSSHSRRYRRAGQVPAVIYGHGKVPRTCLLNEQEWRNLARHKVHLLDLNAGDNTEPTTVLVKEVQFDYLANRLIHVDFVEVRMDEVITSAVPIRAKGTAIGQSRGGVLEQMIHELEVSCTPNDLPELIEVDISAMEIDGVIHIRELALPPQVTPVGAPDQAVFRVTLPRVEEVAATAVVGEEGAAVAGAGAEGAAAEGAEDKDKGKEKEKK